MKENRKKLNCVIDIVDRALHLNLLIVSSSFNTFTKANQCTLLHAFDGRDSSILRFVEKNLDSRNILDILFKTKVFLQLIVIKVGFHDGNLLFICFQDEVFVTDVFYDLVFVAINKKEHALGKVRCPKDEDY